MVDDAWLISKQAEYLKEVIALRRITLELLETLTYLMKDVLTEAEKKNLAHRPNTAHLITRTRQLLDDSEQATGLVVQPLPNEMLQQELRGLPNVDVTLPLSDKLMGCPKCRDPRVSLWDMEKTRADPDASLEVACTRCSWHGPQYALVQVG